MFHIGGRGFVCQIIEPVTFARCAFIFALRNIVLGGYLDTFRTFTARHTDGLKYVMESVDTISRDDPDSPLTQYITNAGISRARYTTSEMQSIGRAKHTVLIVTP